MLVYQRVSLATRAPSFAHRKGTYPNHANFWLDILKTLSGNLAWAIPTDYDITITLQPPEYEQF